MVKLTIDKYLDPKESKNLIIILDTNKSELTQSKDLLKKINRRIVIDHHDIGKTSIKEGLLIIDDEVSSACEMVTRLLEEFDVEIEPYYATVLLAGIVLDTNNFTLKTRAETYYAAYYLASLGASAKKVQYLLKQDLNEYTEREKRKQVVTAHWFDGIVLFPDRVSGGSADGHQGLGCFWLRFAVGGITDGRRLDAAENRGPDRLRCFLFCGFRMGHGSDRLLSVV